MGKYGMDQKVGTINSKDNISILKNLLIDMCDNDYNGSNGIEYYVENEDYVEKKNHSDKELNDDYDNENQILISEFERKWKKVKDLSYDKIIKQILDDNYKGNSYYKDYKLMLTNIDDTIVVSLAYMYVI